MPSRQQTPQSSGSVAVLASMSIAVVLANHQRVLERHLNDDGSSVPTGRTDFMSVDREVVRYGVLAEQNHSDTRLHAIQDRTYLDHFQELLRPIHPANAKLLQQLYYMAQ